MNLVLIFLIVAAISGYIADKKLDDNPDIGIPATAISLFCTVGAGENNPRPSKQTNHWLRMDRRKRKFLS